MFERFTQAARTAVVTAQEEAREQGSPTIAVAHRYREIGSPSCSSAC